MPENTERADFTIDLLRAIAAELHFANLMRASTELYGKGLYQLEPGQVQELNRVATKNVADIYVLLTPVFLKTVARTEAPPPDTPLSGKLQ
jgi:hypothetical protein